jgi:hypothetical protein
MRYDLTEVEYNQQEAMQSLVELNQRLGKCNEAVDTEGTDPNLYRPQFQARRMKTEKIKASPSKGQQVTIEYED